MDESITLPQFRLLAVLDVGGSMNLATLAERLGVNPLVTTRMIDRLTAAGLVDRRVNPANRRDAGGEPALAANPHDARHVDWS